jgi:hypothetical protein
LTGNAQSKEAQAQRREQQREFDTSYGLNAETQRRQQTAAELAQANELRRQLDAAPLRDRVLYNMLARAGVSRQPFAARDMYQNQNTAGSTDPFDADALARANSLYRPGMGGVNNSVAQGALGQLGFTQEGGQGDYTYQNPGPRYQQEAKAEVSKTHWDPTLDKMRQYASNPAFFSAPGIGGIGAAQRWYKQHYDRYIMEYGSPPPNVPTPPANWGR